MLDEIKSRIKEIVLSKIDMSDDIEDEQVSRLIDEAILTYPNLSLSEKLEIKSSLFNRLRRYDILSELLEDEDITEIMINGHQDVFVEKNGRLFNSGYEFESEERLISVIQKIVSSCNRVVNEAHPICDARLYDGSRINVVLPPISLEGAVVTIRKFPKDPMTMDDLIGLGALDKEVSSFLEKLVKAGYNIMISGGTGAGKTTFLNALSGFIPKDERIITIEDSAELVIEGIDNLVRLEARNANVEGENEITIRALIKSSLRQRPDRIIVGEVRDAAALDMVTAMQTGHDGSISTGHANSADDMVGRLETMILMGASMPILAIRKQIASAVDVIIHLGRLRDRSRKVLEICEVIGMKDGDVVLEKLYEYVETGEENGRIVGNLRKINDLHNISKLLAAGLVIEGAL